MLGYLDRESRVVSYDCSRWIITRIAHTRIRTCVPLRGPLRHARGSLPRRATARTSHSFSPPYFVDVPPLLFNLISEPSSLSRRSPGSRPFARLNAAPENRCLSTTAWIVLRTSSTFLLHRGTTQRRRPQLSLRRWVVQASASSEIHPPRLLLSYFSFFSAFYTFHFTIFRITFSFEHLAKSFFVRPI